jgi:hypothetical protein
VLYEFYEFTDVKIIMITDKVVTTMLSDRSLDIKYGKICRVKNDPYLSLEFLVICCK